MPLWLLGALVLLRCHPYLNWPVSAITGLGLIFER